MFAAQRIKIIKEYLLKNKSVDIVTLTKLLDVSDVTVRKDLDSLEKEGFLEKTHGGATLVEDKISSDVQDVQILNYNLKHEIADLAATLIEEGDSIFLGAGSTCYLLAKKLREKSNITVITNNVNAIHILSPHIEKVFLVGGEVVNKNGLIYLTGSVTEEYFNGKFVTKCILSCEGVDIKAGFTINDLSHSMLIKKIPPISKNVIMLNDYTKFDKIGFYQLLPITQPDCIVTNERVSDSYKDFFYNHNIKLLTAYKNVK